MFFIKLIRILAAVLAIGLVCHLLYSTGKKNGPTRHRKKFVRSSVIEKNDETSDKENS